MKNELENMNSITLGQLKKFTRTLSKKIGNDENTEIGFELIIASLFPQAYHNMKDALARSYIEGYNAGKSEFDNIEIV